MLIEKQQQAPVVVTQGSAETTIVNDVTEEKLKPMEESIQYVKSELSYLKDLLLKLQNFTMETNQKLSDIVFREEEKSAAITQSIIMSLRESGMNMDSNIKIIDGEQDTHFQIGDDGLENDTNNTFQSTNLKELVKQELMNEESVVEEGASSML